MGGIFGIAMPKIPPNLWFSPPSLARRAPEGEAGKGAGGIGISPQNKFTFILTEID